MRAVFTLLFLTGFMCGFAQVKVLPPTPLPVTPQQPAAVTEQQLESITENNEDMETEDDSYLLELVQYQKNPVNLNTADESMLKELRLNPVQIQTLQNYRSLLGNLLNIYELQAVPGWDVQTIQRIRPYVTVSDRADLIESIGERLSNGDHTVLVRVSQTLERGEGYVRDPNAGLSYYRGSPQRLFVRYRYSFKNLLQYGVVGEKDAGEELFKGSQKKGFDFYSAHFFLRRAGIIKSLALGDYTVNMGQGLTSWMSLAFKKSVDITSTKRQADVLRPYNSAGEINFHRGAAITLARRNWEVTLFGSYRNRDGNFNTDTSQTFDDFVSSLQTSGFHRTDNEVSDKGVQKQLAFGGNISYRWKALHAGINAVQYRFKFPLQKAADPYNYYALQGKSLGNYSVDYSYTYRNLHFFGEAAISNKNFGATVNGLLITAANNVDLSFVYRNISPGYQSLYTTAFTENTFPTNERGLFGGISLRPRSGWRVDAYADFFRFPFLKFRTNSPTTGSDYLAQVTYTPNKVFEMYVRFKSESKPINFNPEELVLSPVVPQPRQNFRTQFSYRITSDFTLRSRAEAVWFDKKGEAAEKGFLLYGDVIYNPVMKRYSAGVRVQYFETDGYNSRIYAFENDVLYSFSIPVFSGKGYRYYLNLNYALNKRIGFWARIGQFYYPGQKTTGSSLDEVTGPRKTDLKVQIQYKF